MSSQDCSTFRDQVSLLVGGDLSSALRVSLMAHASRCPSCRDELDAEHRLDEILALWEIPKAPRRLSERLYQRLAINEPELSDELLEGDTAEAEAFSCWVAPIPPAGFLDSVMSRVEEDVELQIAGSPSESGSFSRALSEWKAPSPPAHLVAGILSACAAESQQPRVAQTRLLPRHSTHTPSLIHVGQENTLQKVSTYGAPSFRSALRDSGGLWKGLAAAAIIVGATLLGLFSRPASVDLSRPVALETWPSPKSLDDPLVKPRIDFVDILASSDPVDPFLEPLDHKAYGSSSGLHIRQLARLAASHSR